MGQYCKICNVIKGLAKVVRNFVVGVEGDDTDHSDLETISFKLDCPDRCVVLGTVVYSHTPLLRCFINIHNLCNVN